MYLSVKRINDGKKYFQDSMRSVGLTTYESFGNFVHVKFGKYGSELHKVLDGKVYYRKDFNNTCLKGYSRFSTTTIERFKPIIDCITNVVIQHKDRGKRV